MGTLTRGGSTRRCRLVARDVDTRPLIFDNSGCPLPYLGRHSFLLHSLSQDLPTPSMRVLERLHPRDDHRRVRRCEAVDFVRSVSCEKRNGTHEEATYLSSQRV